MKSIAMLAVAGLAAAASAQSATFTITSDRSVVNVGEEFTLTVSVATTGPALITRLDASLVGDAGLASVQGGSNLFSAVNNSGVFIDGSADPANLFVQALNAGADFVVVQIGDFLIPGPLFSVTYLATAEGVFTADLAGGLLTGLGNLADFNTSAPGALANPALFVAFDSTVIGTSVQIVPTPGSLALLGLGGLAAARRRR